MKKKYIIFVILLIVLPILVNELINRPKYNLINDGKKLLDNVSTYVKNNNVSLEEIVINNKYEMNNKTYNVKGEGVIFIDKTISFMLSRSNMCVMKLDNSDNIMIQDGICPSYRMFNGIKEKIVSSGNGLYKEDDYYIYKGKGVSNLLLYDNSLWYILKIDNTSIKIVSLTSIGSTSYLTLEDYNNSISDGTFLVKSMIGNEVKELSRESLYVEGYGLINDPYIIK